MSLHTRPTVAKWLQDLSLGTRLSFVVGLIVVGVVTSVAYLEIRSFEQHIESDLEDSARLGARSAADACLSERCRSTRKTFATRCTTSSRRTR